MTLKKAETTLVIDPLKQGVVTVRVVGTTPLYIHAMSAKAKRSLLVGSTKKTAAEKRDIKHVPFEEYQETIYKTEEGPTLLCFPSPAFKGAMATAALETKGIAKTSVNRLVFLPQISVPVWGKPMLKMDIVRSADMNKTPDVRTRAYLPRWAAEFDVRFIAPVLSAASIYALVQNAGIVCGIGDFRQEKGKGSFGTFRLANDDDEEFLALQAEGRDIQRIAYENPELADLETVELMAEFHKELKTRAAA